MQDDPNVVPTTPTPTTPAPETETPKEGEAGVAKEMEAEGVSVETPAA